jgi:hypothetical protein
VTVVDSTALRRAITEVIARGLPDLPGVKFPVVRDVENDDWIATPEVRHAIEVRIVPNIMSALREPRP